MVRHEASILGGLAINRTGTVFPHNVGYYLTERYHIPHGFASASLMSALLDHVNASAPELAQRFYAEAGITEEALRGLLDMCLPSPEASATEAELLTALPRWRNNGSVQNTVGSVSEEQIFAALKQFLMKKERVRP